MKYRIIKIAIVFAILIHLTSCFHHVRTDNKRPDRYRYHRAGRSW